MIVISDTSPINNLAAIGYLHLLQSLYETVIIPEAVYQELTDPEFPVSGATEVQTLDWITTCTCRDLNLVEALCNELDRGEAEAIALALEFKADVLLIDERQGRLVADKFHIYYTGVLGVLVEAKKQDLIKAVRPLLDDLIDKAGFWIALPLYNKVLQLVEENE
ncbi:DUF3368 domain-containing protein [Roseofilum capinflatum]|uniref:DUF3368 domain-containing protein n=1 Tax=Roseofilum capinflatum BLCC-M114 TaxID=3022440 RepID=A0ABT7B3H4_9CYAN|nr:DUF3368 domain-containing protein [Roseofilum capinflatum]MDJ1173666.1 DUF3368 domain-containing protein [Roseofilum capinflatum BLCC-M114]